MPITVDIPGLGEVEFPDSIPFEEVQKQAAALFDQYSKKATPTNAPAQLEPNAIQRVIRSKPVQSVLGPLKAGMQGIEEAAAFLGNEAIAAYKMATGQPIEKPAVARQVPILDAQGRPTGQTQFVQDTANWESTYKQIKPGQPIFPFGPANEFTSTRIGRDEADLGVDKRVLPQMMQGINQGIAGFASGLTTPGNLATLPLVLGKVLKVVGPMTTREVGERMADAGLRTAFAAPMIEQSLEGGARAIDNRLPAEERIQGGIEAILSGLLGTKIATDMLSRGTVAPGAEGSQLVPTRQFINGEWQTVFQPANLIGESGLKPGDFPAAKGMLYGKAPTDQGQIAKDLAFLGIDPNQRVGRPEPADFMRPELEELGYGVRQLKPEDLVPRQAPLLTPEQAEAGLGQRLQPRGLTPVNELIKESRRTKATPKKLKEADVSRLESAAYGYTLNNRKYTPAVRTTSGEIIKGESHEQAWSLVDSLGLKAGERGRGYVDAQGKFYTLLDIARAESLDQGTKAAPTSLPAPEAPKVDVPAAPEVPKPTLTTIPDLSQAGPDHPFRQKADIDLMLAHPDYWAAWGFIANDASAKSMPDNVLLEEFWGAVRAPEKDPNSLAAAKNRYAASVFYREIVNRGLDLGDKALKRHPAFEKYLEGAYPDEQVIDFKFQRRKLHKESIGKNKEQGQPEVTGKETKVIEAPKPTGESGRLYMNPIGPLFKPVYQMGKEGVKMGAEKVKAAVETGVDLVNFYSRPLVQRLEGKGGPVTQKLSTDALNIVDDSKKVYGDLATKSFDEAKRATGRLNAANKWFRGTQSITPETRVSRWYRSMEEQGANVPAHAQKAFKASQDANLYAGQTRQTVAPGFIPGGKPQRMLTPDGMDLVLNDAKGRDAWIKGIAKASNVPEAKVRAHVDQWAAELAKQVPDVTTLERIAQDFRQQYPKVPTQVKTGMGWVQVIQDDPFRYLDQLQRETAEVVAFRRVFPRDSGKLQKIIDDVTRELTDRSQGSDVEGLHQMLRALQGQPVDNTRSAAGMRVQRLISKIDPAIQVFKSANLTASFFPNLAELAYGGPEMFLGTKTGWRSGIKLLMDMPQQDINRQMEMMGARDKFMRNWAWDPRRPVESGARYLSNTLNKISGTSLINEIQEGKAAFAARIVADDIVSGNLSASRAKDLRTLLRMMGWTEAEAAATIKGDKALVDRFVRKSASWLTGGNVARAEMSRAGASRIFNTVFWFHRYPQMVANRLRANMVLLIDDTKALMNAGAGRQSEHWSRVARDVKMLTKQAVGLGVQGAVANGILATLGAGGYYGTQQLRERFQNHPLETIMEFYRTALGGPVAMTARLMENAGDFDKVVREALGTSALFGNLAEFYNFSVGAGRYRTLSPGDRVMKFLGSRTPGHKAFLTGMAVTGLADWDPELEAAMKGLSRWRKDKGYASVVDPGKDSTVEFRAQMRKVTKELEKGGDWVSELQKIPDTSMAARSLRAKTFLVGDGDKPLTAEEEKDLASYIGQKGVEKLRMRDAALREIARELAERDPRTGQRPTPSELPKPTPGSKAIDMEAASARGERTLGMLKPETQAILKRNEIAGFNYEPKARAGRLLTPEEGRQMETNYVREFEKLMNGFEKRYGDNSMAAQRKVISRYMEAARARSAPKK